MKKYLSVAGGLFLLHTVEEALFRFWQTDTLSLHVAQSLKLPLILVYWVVQVVLYALILFALLAPRKKPAAFAYTLVGLVLLAEFEHPILAWQTHSYQPGLITGVVLAIYSLVYCVQLMRYYVGSQISGQDAK